MIAALAGRRVDANDVAPARFPLRNIERVSQALEALLVGQDATALVSSAACGADLIGLSVAGKLGLRRRVVLPFSRQRFRETSVADRPGEWGGLYDAILDEVTAMGDLVIMEELGGADPYRAASHLVLDEAVVLGQERRESVMAVVVWDGMSRGNRDYTDEFGREARTRGLTAFQILTV